MTMRRQVLKNVAKTHIIRTPVMGPPPANTLVYLECRVGGTDEPGILGAWDRVEIELLTEFQIEDYEQKHHQWYLDNTLVSATAMLRFLNTSTDLAFTFGVDRVEPFLTEQDGRLGFRCQQGILINDDAIISGHIEAVMAYSISAYVLCHEPSSNRPPSGQQRTPWSRFIEKIPSSLKSIDAFRITIGPGIKD
jgi:hypothetical protein